MNEVAHAANSVTQGPERGWLGEQALNTIATSAGIGSVDAKEQLGTYGFSVPTVERLEQLERDAMAARRAHGLPTTGAEWRAIFGAHGFKPCSQSVDRKATDLRYIYFLKSGDLLKIGMTLNVAQRMHSFRAGAPRGLTLRGTRAVPASLGRQVEMQIHAALREFDIGREWFRVEAPHARAVAQPIVDRAWRAQDDLCRAQWYYG